MDWWHWKRVDNRHGLHCFEFILVLPNILYMWVNLYGNKTDRFIVISSTLSSSIILAGFGSESLNLRFYIIINQVRGSFLNVNDHNFPSFPLQDYLQEKSSWETSWYNYFHVKCKKRTSAAIFDQRIVCDLTRGFSQADLSWADFFAYTLFLSQISRM